MSTFALQFKYIQTLSYSHNLQCSFKLNIYSSTLKT